jgi:flagellar biosynthesis protein FliR
VSLAQVVPANLFAALLVFARVGAAMMLMPGFGEAYVPPRYRLLLALLLSAVLTPVLAPLLPQSPDRPLRLAVLLGGELVAGFFIGTVARIIISALETTGSVVSLQLGLSAAQIFNPLAATQGAVTSALYSALGVLLIFLTDLHHLLLRAIVDSYALIAPGTMPVAGDLSATVAHVVSGSFRLAIELSAPFILLGVVFSVGLGLISRLVPQLQILFVTQPLQILGGLVAFAIVLVTGMRWFLESFVHQLGVLTQS